MEDNKNQKIFIKKVVELSKVSEQYAIAIWYTLSNDKKTTPKKTAIEWHANFQKIHS